MGVTGCVERGIGMGVRDGVSEFGGGAEGIVGWGRDWDGAAVREEFNGRVVSFGTRGWDIDAVAAVVLSRGAEVPPVNAVGRPGAAP